MQNFKKTKKRMRQKNNQCGGNMKKKKVLFISSTGGHFNELMQLKPMFEKYDYHIITEKDKFT